MMIYTKLTFGILAIIVVVTASLISYAREKSRSIASVNQPSLAPKPATPAQSPVPTFLTYTPTPQPSEPPFYELRQEQSLTPPTPPPKTSSAKVAEVNPPLAQALNRSEEAAIEFISLPNSLPAGQTTTIQWRVVGPSGAQGDNASIRISYNQQKNSGNSSSSVSSTNEQSFGSFTVPETFSTNLSMSGEGNANIEVSATVNGKTITAHRNIPLS